MSVKTARNYVNAQNYCIRNQRMPKIDIRSSRVSVIRQSVTRTQSLQLNSFIVLNEAYKTAEFDRFARDLYGYEITRFLGFVDRKSDCTEIHVAGLRITDH